MEDTNDYKMFLIDYCAGCHQSSTKKCGDCKIQSYCSENCQKHDRNRHRKLMQCSKENTLMISDENKIVFSELLEAQANLCYAFLDPGTQEFGAYESNIQDHLEKVAETILPEDSAVTVPIVVPQLLDLKLFKTYRGNVYFHHNCFGLQSGEYDGHHGVIDPIVIATGDDTANMTIRCLLEKLCNAVSIYLNEELEEYLAGNERPILTCGVHRLVEEINLFQMRQGVIIMINCGIVI